MDPEVLAWAQVLALELVERGHPSLQTTLMAGLFSGRQQWQNYCLPRPDISTSIGLCLLYASVGLVDRLKQAMTGQSFFHHELCDIIAAAARGGHWSVLRRFFQHGYYRNSDHIIQLTLENAVRAGHEDIVSIMLSYNIPGLPLSFLLGDAARAGHVGVLKLLLQVSTPLHTKMTNLILSNAICSRSVAMVSTALSLEPAPSSTYITKAAVKAAEVESQPVAVVELFQEFVGVRHRNLMLVAASGAGNLELVHYLLDRGAGSAVANATNARWLNAALKACVKKLRLEVAELLLSRGARDVDGSLTAHEGPEMAQLLLARGAVNPNKVLKHRQLYFEPAVVKLLLEAGVSRLGPALTLVLTMLDFVKPRQSALLLLRAGASNVNAALVAGARANYLPMVELALERGASAYQEAIDEASRAGHQEMAGWLAARAEMQAMSSL